MSSERIFVGRTDELSQFEKILASPQGRAVVVVGQPGMGKTMLVNRMADRAGNHPDLRCGFVRYEVTPSDSPATTMALMIDHAFEAAKVGKPFVSGTDEQWRGLFKAFKAVPVLGGAAEAVGDLALSLMRDPAKDTRTQFMDRLRFISGKMADNGRAIFIVDPEKYMQENSQDDWRLVVRDLPDKIMFLFAQRPEDVLIASRDFMAMDNVLRIPGNGLDVLDEHNIDELVDTRKTELPISTIEARKGVARYEGHPYAVSAALDLIGDGRAIEHLPADPTKEEIARTQWDQVCDKHDKAVDLLEAYALLEVAVPDEVAQPVSGGPSSVRRTLLSNPYLSGLLRDEPDGTRIYHSLLADHICGQVSQQARKGYHTRAIDVYRKRLKAEVRPDALAAARLPEHVLAAEGPQAFVKAFTNECTSALLTLGLLDAAEGLSRRSLELVDVGTVEEAAVTGNLGVIHRTRGDLDRAEEMHRKALEIEEKLGRLEGMADQYGNLGLVYGTRGDLDRAEETHRKSLEIEEKLGRLEGMAAQYGNLGLIYGTRGDLDRAEEMHCKALELNKKLGRLEGMAIQYGNLGVIYGTRGDLDRAEKMHCKALEIDEKLGCLGGIASQYGSLGVIYGTRGDLDRAEQMLREALQINEKLGCLEGMANEYGNLGLIYQARGDLDRTEEMLRRSLKIEEKLGRREGMANHHANLGAICEMRGDVAKARGLWRQARELYERIGLPHMVEKVQGWLDELPPATP